MDARRFDQVARKLGAGTPRRSLLHWLLALVLSGPFFPWRDEATTEAKGRRERRKQRHKRASSHRRSKRQRRKQRLQRKSRKKNKRCQAGQPCGEPGQLCQSDGSCTCESASCPACQACSVLSGLCEPDPDTVGYPCGEPIQICRADGVCACPDTGCGGVCGCDPGFMCDEGECQPCDVRFDGNSITSGQALQNHLDSGGTIRVCPGRYQHTFVVSASVTLIGAGDGEDAASSTILDAGGNGRTLSVSPSVTALLRGMRISGGDDNLGGGIYNEGGLALTACTVSGNNANLGGGIYNAFAATGALTLLGCSLADNDANRGGAIDNSGILTVTISGCTFTKNRSDGDAGAIYNNGGGINITGSEISENESQADGGGIYNATPVVGNPGEVTFDAGCRVTNNRAASTGGGIFNDGVVTLNGAAVANNKPDNCAGDPVAGCIEDA